MKIRNGILVAAILIVGGGLLYYVMQARGTEVSGGHDDHAHDDHGGEFERGPHGGRLLESDLCELELVIFEEGMPPQFRVYPYAGGKPLAPADVDLRIELGRLGGKTDVIEFVSEHEYLRGVQAVEEPHSFDVRVIAGVDGHEQVWTYASYEGRVTLSPEAAATAGIETQEAGPATVRQVVRLPGDIQLDPERVVHVVPRVSGVVSSVSKGLGDTVAVGDLLAVIDSRELADVRSGLMAARERMGLARSRYEREQRLFNDQISSEEDFLTAKEALANAEIDARTAEQKLISLGVPADAALNRNSEGAAPLTAYPIHSSIDGVVIAKHITHGEAVVPDSDIYLLADLTSVWAEVVVYAQDLRRVRVGQSVTIRSEDLDKSTEGTISYIGPLLGEETRTARAIVEVPNPDREWSPGLFVTVEIVEEESPVEVAVTVDAIQTFRDWEIVFVKYGDVYEVRPLELGQRDEEFVEVLDGLEAGEVYVTKNSYVLKADLGKAGAAHEH